MPVKINRFEIENVKRVKAVRIEPAAEGLTIIGGDNGQGKTSVLDAIAWALGGEAHRPTAAAREGSAVPPALHVVLDNGLVVERKGKNSALRVTDPNGNKGGQQLLNEFVEQLALDLPKFMQSSGKEKAAVLLKIIGVGDRLAELERTEKEKYNERQSIGRIADQKEKYAAEQPYYPDAPKDLVSASELIKEQQEILARNGERQKLIREQETLKADIETKKQKILDARDRLHELQEELKDLNEKLELSQKPAEELEMESTEELEQNIANVEEINRKVRANLDKEKAEDDAKQYRHQYETLTKEIAETRKAKTDLLNGAELPLPGLSVEDGELTYNGQKWDCMSGSEQLKVSTAIVRKLNPACGFVLLDKLEQMDLTTLKEFGEWLEGEGLQAIATRVSTGDECEIIIEDGYSYKDGKKTLDILDEQEEEKPRKPTAGKWKKGVFA